MTSNVKQSFNHDEEFLEFATNGYVVFAAMHVLNMQSLNDIPNSFPNTEDKQMHFFPDVFLSTQPYVKHILQDQSNDPEQKMKFVYAGQPIKIQEWYTVQTRTAC